MSNYASYLVYCNMWFALHANHLQNFAIVPIKLKTRQETKDCKLERLQLNKYENSGTNSGKAIASRAALPDGFGSQTPGCNMLQ